MTLQEQYNLIKGGKGHKGVFLTEAKRNFPNFITNPMGFNEVVSKLKSKSILSENYIDLIPIGQYESSIKEDWENAYSNFLKEEVKAESKSTDKSVDDLNSKGFDRADKNNLDNQIGVEVMNGIYVEANKTPDKTIDELKKIVAKNLAKDPLFYKKNAAFGIDGVGYEEKEIEEVSGKHKESGYSDKLKKLVKESLIKKPLNEQYFDNLEDAKQYARSESEEGFVQHVNKDGRGGYIVEDWYDSDNTVASYGGGDLNEELDDTIEKTKELTDSTKELAKAKEEAGIKEDHTDNPNDKYVVKPCSSPGKPFAVWEGDVKVKEFTTKEEAQSYADKQNK
jgi:hypothetical protein